MSGPRGFFITGTNTDVGKTVVTRAMTGALVARGIRAVALKPVESGVRDVPLDASALAAVSHGAPSADAVSLYGFRDPVSPHLAAHREGRIIEAGPILAFLDEWSRKAELLLVEGAGGLLVPLSATLTFGDVVAGSGLPLVVVAPNVLGTINATLLTIEAARARRIPIAGVVLNGTPDADLGNRDAIETHGQISVLGELPRVDVADDGALTAAAQAHLDLDTLVSMIVQGEGNGVKEN